MKICGWMGWQTGVVLAMWLGGMCLGEMVAVNMPLTPAAGSVNNLTLKVTATISGITKSDDAVSAATGNLLTKVEADFDKATGAPVAIKTLEFTGGNLSFSDVAFKLNYGFLLGAVNITGKGMGGTADTPVPPGTVSGGQFNNAEHQIILNRGVLNASGTGVVGALFPPTTIDLAVTPLVTTSTGTGTIGITLTGMSGQQASYLATVVIPVNFSEVAMENPANGLVVLVSGTGTIKAAGTFTRNFCPLVADLTGDCKIDTADLAKLAANWLKGSAVRPCVLAGELAGGDCFVDLADFAVLAGDWLEKR